MLKLVAYLSKWRTSSKSQHINTKTSDYCTCAPPHPLSAPDKGCTPNQSNDSSVWRLGYQHSHGDDLTAGGGPLRSFFSILRLSKLHVRLLRNNKKYEGHQPRACPVPELSRAGNKKNKAYTYTFIDPSDINADSFVAMI